MTLDRDGQFLLTSDTVAIEDNLRQNIAPKVTTDAPQFYESFKRVRDIERNGAKLIFGHDLAQWLTLRKGAEFYE